MGLVDIYNLRKQLRLTQAALAALLLVSVRTIKRWEADEMRLDIQQVRKLVRQ